MVLAVAAVAAAAAGHRATAWLHTAAEDRWSLVALKTHRPYLISRWFLGVFKYKVVNQSNQLNQK